MQLMMYVSINLGGFVVKEAANSKTSYNFKEISLRKVLYIYHSYGFLTGGLNKR